MSRHLWVAHKHWLRLVKLGSTARGWIPTTPFNPTHSLGFILPVLSISFSSLHLFLSCSISDEFFQFFCGSMFIDAPPLRRPHDHSPPAANPWSVPEISTINFAILALLPTSKPVRSDLNETKWSRPTPRQGWGQNVVSRPVWYRGLNISACMCMYSYSPAGDVTYVSSSVITWSRRVGWRAFPTHSTSPAHVDRHARLAAVLF